MSHNLHMLTQEEISEHTHPLNQFSQVDVEAGLPVFTVGAVEHIIANRRKDVESQEALQALRQKLTGDNPNVPYPSEDTDPDMNDGPEPEEYTGVTVHCPGCTQSFTIRPRPTNIRLMDNRFSTLPYARIPIDDEDAQDIIENDHAGYPFNRGGRRHYMYKQIVVQFEPFRIPDHACNPRYVGR